MDSININSSPNPQQQFCLRWHNHQTSLLSTLPLLLDQSHLTDVTLSAEGKTLRAHRVVLSACSTFFSELFRTLDSNNISNFHPVIVIPGAQFTTVVALLTFMYSGEVNVYEGQIPTLLTLAETLGIKGLADFQGKKISKLLKQETNPPMESEETLVPSKIPSLENFLIKSFQLYPSILNQPLNFSQSALNKTADFLKSCQQQFNSVQTSNETDETSLSDQNLKRSCSGDRKTKDVKKIDKIAENLRATSNKSNLDTILPKIPSSMVNSGTSLGLKSSPFHTLSHHFMQTESANNNITESLSINQQSSNPLNSSPENLSTFGTLLDKTSSACLQKPNNSKLYATCFICHKQLSNQYNLRVHLETHQNVRYACNVCSHVSRSKDALRKHVSYRHPGTPSPCETETRRKRLKGIGTLFPSVKIESNERTITPPTISNQSLMFLSSKYNSNTAAVVTNSQTPSSPSISTPSTMKKSTSSEINTKKDD